jgi:hypothetical protein
MSNLIPEELQSAYAENHLALGLGAGVSVQSKVPDWRELVRRVAEQPEVRPTREIATSLLQAGHDATVVAGYLRSRAGSEKVFVEAVRRSLYSDLNVDFAAFVERHNTRNFARFVRDTNTTLHAIGTFCARRLASDRFGPNTAVRAVLNFNLDNLLQTYTAARFKKRVLRTVERASASASSRRINTYHPHGYLLREVEPETPANPKREAGDRLVLTEHQYIDVVANSNGFVNYTMLHVLREYNFLFIGLSMTDPNLRRALHVSRSERRRELLAEGLLPTSAERASRRHWSVMQRQNEDLDQATSQMLGELGVAPIWVLDWTKVPALLAELYESVAKPEHPIRWSDVA